MIPEAPSAQPATEQDEPEHTRAEEQQCDQWK
jgi:hypothetical protein